MHLRLTLMMFISSGLIFGSALFGGPAFLMTDIAAALFMFGLITMTIVSGVMFAWDLEDYLASRDEMTKHGCTYCGGAVEGGGTATYPVCDTCSRW